MKRLTVLGLILVFAALLLMTPLCIESVQAPIARSTTLGFTSSSQASGSHFGMYDDVLIAPDLPNGPSRYVASPSSAPGYYETSEYLIGSVAVGIILLESNGTIDPSTEDWTTTRENSVASEIRDGGLFWLTNYYSKANVRFLYDIHYRVPTRYEPINHPSTYAGYWISEAMTYLGYPGVYYLTQVRDYINGLRDALRTDWAFTIFVVDSYYDSNGKFADGYSAYAYLGGPFLVLTYDNGNYGIGNMDWVCAHETGHIFYATDEYDNTVQYSGYLNAPDTKYTTSCLMGQPTTFLWWINLPWSICQNSRLQLGWRDTDLDGIQDIVDTFPDTFLNPYEPDPTDEVVLTYTGNAAVIPYPNNNPYGTSRDVTIVKVMNVQFRVDYGNWMGTMSTDGAFDEAEEDFAFTTPTLLEGTHTIDVRSVNSVGNIEVSYASDTISVKHKNDTNIMFVLFPNPVDQGQLVTLAGNLTETGSGKPLANTRVDAYVDGTFADYFVTNGSGWFEWSDYVWVLGIYQVRVTYSGNASYNPSNHTETLTVQMPGKVDTQLVFTLSPNPVGPGVTVTLSGTLKDAVNNPVYPAQVKVDYSTNGGATWISAFTLNTNAAGQFSSVFNAPRVGTYQVRVNYAGSTAYNPSSKTETLAVQTGAKLNTLIVFSFSPNPASPSQSVTLSGTLKNVNGNPVYPAQLTVQYSTNGGATWNYIFTLNTNAAGQFSVSFGAPGKGSYLARVSYAGSASYNPSSSTQTLTVS